jgi:cytochrome c-type biogenesis protein CcmH
MIFALMLAAAAVLVVWPAYRRNRRLSAPALSILLVLLLVTPALYLQIGTPKPAPIPHPDVGTARGLEATVTSLAARLETNPEDLAGWKMLGRSYIELRRLPEAIAAFERAVEIESGKDAQTLTDLGEAIFLNDQSTINGRAGQLFETALSLAPANPKALFYGGMVAINRGDPALGADRWEALLASSPPKNVEGILRQRIAELRGELPPMPQASTAPAQAPDDSGAATGSEGVLTLNVELSADAASAVSPQATVFVIARDPAQPSPPIAAVRRRASELPTVVTLSDSDAMIPGRVPSAFAELEIIARVSMSGSPIASSGDWFGERTFRNGSTGTLSIRIDQQVP